MSFVRGRFMRALLVVLSALAAPEARGQDDPSAGEAKKALVKAVRFFHAEVARHGGYLWEYSGDLNLREAEGRATPSQAWVQPPGTPAVGLAFLDAYDATGDPSCLRAAVDAGQALLLGQMRTGGWGYSVEFDPALRREFAYRAGPPGRTSRWKKATVLDDDTTAAALRFLARLDRTLGSKDEKVRDAVRYGLEHVIRAQHPNGAWFGWWEHDPAPPSEKAFPVLRASYPKEWSRTWKGWPAKYVLNDNLAADMIRTLLELHDTYQDGKALAAAHRAGGFLLLAQMPEPQPAWAQQYDVDTHPCWGRKFEPPAITGLESQSALESLLLLYRRTGEKKYLEPVPRALAYLKKSRLPDGRLARFYELQTNRPLYFTKDYQLTYEADDLPTHYGFIVPSRLDAVEKTYQALREAPDPAKVVPPATRVSAERARAIIGAMDGRGAWVEKGRLRFHKVEPASGVIRCRTFIDNVHALSRYAKQ